MSRVIVCGDVHGCLQELDQLLGPNHVGFRPGKDRLIFLGDIVDRGPDPIGCLRRVRELGAEVMKGNHEVKHLRAMKNGKDPEEAFGRWPERVFQHRAMVQHGLLSWVDTWPYYIQVEPNLVAVHAGFEPDIPVEKQSWEACVYTRYVHKDTKRRSKTSDDYFPGEPHDDAVPWMELWRGPDVVYGHIVWDLQKEKETRSWSDSSKSWTFTWGIDTGGCFGGHLTAAVWDPGDAFPHFVRVKCQPYAKLWHPTPGV